MIYGWTNHVYWHLFSLNNFYMFLYFYDIPTLHTITIFCCNIYKLFFVKNIFKCNWIIEENYCVYGTVIYYYGIMTADINI